MKKMKVKTIDTFSQKNCNQKKFFRLSVFTFDSVDCLNPVKYSFGLRVLSRLDTFSLVERPLRVPEFIIKLLLYQTLIIFLQLSIFP